MENDRFHIDAGGGGEDVLNAIAVGFDDDALVWNRGRRG